MEVFILKEVNVLSSEETEIYINVFETHKKAYVEMLENIKEHEENNGAIVSELWENGSELSDENNNTYSFEISKSVVK